jgi:hypothetical protein
VGLVDKSSPLPKAARSIGADDGTKWFYIEEEDEDLRALFTALYLPNAPDSEDGISVEGKNLSPLPFNEKRSAAVLGLFTVSFPGNGGLPVVDIAGPSLPPGATSQKEYHPLVIDLGLPDADNRDLPLFCLTRGTLGTVEIMDGGALSDDTYEGLLGEEGTVIARLGSSLSVGP